MLCATHSHPAFVGRVGKVRSPLLLSWQTASRWFAPPIVEQCRQQQSPSRLHRALPLLSTVPNECRQSPPRGHHRLPIWMQPAQQLRIGLVLDDGKQVICCHSRWTWGCTPPGCPETREQSISIQFKGLRWFRSQNLLAIRVWALVGVEQGLSIPSKLSTFLASHWRCPRPAELRTTLPNAPNCARSTRL